MYYYEVIFATKCRYMQIYTKEQCYTKRQTDTQQRTTDTSSQMSVSLR